MDYLQRMSLAEFSKQLLRLSSAPPVERRNDGEAAPVEDSFKNGFAAHVVLGMSKSHD
jgi:hypothetical protein